MTLVVAIIIGSVILLSNPIAKVGRFYIKQTVKHVINKKKYRRNIKKTFVAKKEIDELCVICQEDYTENKKCCQLKCKHTFHKKCYLTWAKESTRCPLCSYD